jgi:hypothetical protein
MKGESGPKPAPQGPAAKPDTQRHLTTTDRLPVQLSLFGESTDPADGMYPPRAWAAAEWHLRLAANGLAYEREPRHWWAREAERRRDGAA